MSKKKKPFTAESVQQGEWQRIVIAGALDEDAKLRLNDLLMCCGPKVILDLGSVQQINSCGVRDWSHFVRALKEGREVLYENCTDEVVRTFNMVRNFQAKIPVRSLLRSYACPACNHEQDETFQAGTHFTEGQVPATTERKCRKCGAATEAFEDDESFFSFLLTG